MRALGFKLCEYSLCRTGNYAVEFVQGRGRRKRPAPSGRDYLVALNRWVVVLLRLMVRDGRRERYDALRCVAREASRALAFGDPSANARRRNVTLAFHFLGRGTTNETAICVSGLVASGAWSGTAPANSAQNKNKPSRRGRALGLSKIPRDKPLRLVSTLKQSISGRVLHGQGAEQ
jgi:hypothetical protein